MAEILGVEGRDPYFLVSDIARTPQLREMVCHIPWLELVSENLGMQVDHMLSAIGQVEQDRQFTRMQWTGDSVERVAGQTGQGTFLPFDVSRQAGDQGRNYRGSVVRG